MIRGTLLVALGACAVLAACGVAAPAPSPAPARAAAPVGAASITPTDFHARVALLASDALRGRETPSPGLDAAAAYLVSEYLRLGLAPAGENGSFYQMWPYPEVALDTTTVHFGTLVGGRENRMLRYGTDFYAHAVPSAAASPAMNHARLAYAGVPSASGLPAGDYRGTAPVVAVPGTHRRDWRAAVNRARRAAQSAGATALVVVVAPEFPAATFATLAQQARAPQRRAPAAPDEIPVFYLTSRAAAGIAARAGQDWARLPPAPGAPVVLDGIEAHFAATALTLDQGLAPNVVAVLPGSDPELRDEYVILSAHMDHVGVGRPVNGDSIYNGADDNASGTAALVEIAEALASLPQPPGRSVVFLHVSGEEHGLLGSRWYSEHPTLPMGQVVANINLDMIARNAPDSVVVIGKEYSSLGAVVNAAGTAHPELGLVVSDDIWPAERFFFRSDHFNFARKEIPALFFFSGIHEDYHRPSDHLETLDLDKATRVTRLVYHTLLEIANQPQRPTWDPAGLAEVRAMTR